jgi:hypothetical protein
MLKFQDVQKTNLKIVANGFTDYLCFMQLSVIILNYNVRYFFKLYCTKA